MSFYSGMKPFYISHITYNYKNNPQSHKVVSKHSTIEKHATQDYLAQTPPSQL